MRRVSLASLPKRSTTAARESVARALVAFDAGTGPDAVHDLRVALRRAVAVTRVFRGLPEKGAGASAGEKARDLRQRLSGPRQLDVSRTLVEKLPEGHRPLATALLDAHPAPPADLPALRAEAEALLELLAEWSARLETWRPTAQERRRLERKVARRLERAREKVLAIGIPSARTLHAQRVATKSFRYRLEVAAPFVRGADRLLKTLRRLQTALGDANDWAGLAEDLRAGAGGRETKGETALHARVARERVASERAAREEVRRALYGLRRADLSIAPARR